MNLRHFALTGYPLSHTMSPFIHQKLLACLGVAGEYHTVELPPEQLSGGFAALSRLDGFNCTIPHKSAVLPLLDRIDERAAFYGAVNTVKCGTETVGYNTDCTGFLRALGHARIPLAGRLLVCGTGGVSRMMACEGALAGCEVILACRPQSLTKGASLARELCEKIPGASIACTPYAELSGEFDLLVNGTPCGMHPHTGEMPVTPSLLARCHAVFDCIYNPEETLLLRQARANGSACGYGMPMLVWQAAAAQEIWNDAVFSPADVNAVIEEANAEMERIFHET